ncbi:MAG: ATP-dependent DNA helicase RecG [Spirochaetia bacterium]
MLLWELAREASSLRGVGPALARRLERLGVRTARDLLLLVPRGYEDRTTVVPLSRAAGRDKVAVVADVSSVTDIGWAARGRARTPKAIVTDGSSDASLVCFGRPFLRTLLKPGRRFFIWGRFQLRAGELSCADFELEPWSESPAGFGRILPLYPLTEGLTQAGVRKIVRGAMDAVLPDMEPGLPDSLTRARGFLPTPQALHGLHFPESLPEAESCRNALAYEELFYFEIGVLRRARALAVPRPHPRTANTDLRDRLLARLPFSLTVDQEKVVDEISDDLFSAVPMARLLQGDVGCGKTLVALLSALLVAGSGEQVAFVAPTELLARQHAESAARLVEPLGVRIAFLSGSVTGDPRALLLSALKAGEIDILFGTHALFSDDVAYRNLGLVIIDEQHKFGVLQRQALVRKGEAPDLLLMTATPIPRTLALTAFGDLEVSTIRTMPPGRLPVDTHLAREGNEEKVYAWIRGELAKGRQAYFVYPLIGESESLAVKDAESAFRRLAESVYPGLGVARVHSRVPEEEMEKTMAAFAAGKLSILVATSVVEVGVDVPNATCMVVEHAERFGLSTLHQLRGRVGRGSDQAYAFLVYGKKLTAEGIERLKIMKETTDGFLIAERDMRLRGPGELLGIRQSGFLDFRVADLLVHGALLLSAREDAGRILREDPGLLLPGNPLIAKMLAAGAWASAGLNAEAPAETV